ncbi:hypothetical protein PINS_up009839 [Pythium insidiosum]|nr:hypothetical protein PINS_up009839 [Pythium insidiosum]
MELLVWHAALGCDDEQASDTETLSRLLYAFDSQAPSSPPPSAWQLQALNLMQALVTFSCGLRERRRPDDSPPPSTSVARSGISVTLARRRVFIHEVEPQIFMSLSIDAADGDTELRDAHNALLHDLYDTFRLFFGSFHRRLDRLEQQTPETSAFPDGMALLRQLQSLRKQQRKLQIARELEQDEVHTRKDDGDAAAELQLQHLKTQIDALEAVAPTRRLWSDCHALFPTLLRSLVHAAAPLNVFHELQGLTYFPMDETTFLAVQTFVNSLVAELDGVVHDVALFFKGNVLWRSMPSLRSLHVLQRFLRLREQHGMTVDLWDPPHRQEDDRVASTLWMPRDYDDAFLPIWASKTAYAELTIARHQASSASASAASSSRRSLHRQSSSTLNALIADLVSQLDLSTDSASSPRQRQLKRNDSNGNGSGSGRGGLFSFDKAEQLVLRRTQRFRANTACYRNRGFLTTSGYFLATWELAKNSDSDTFWCPQVYALGDTDDATGRDDARRVIVWHEAELTLLLLVPSDDSVSLSLMERIETALERLDAARLAATIATRFHAMTTSHNAKREKAAATAAPPFVYLNRANLAFTAQHIPRLVKTRDDSSESLFPRPVGLWASYVPSHVLSIMASLNATIKSGQAAHGDVELSVKTMSDGWVVMRHTHSTQRQLVVFLDTKSSCVPDVQGTYVGERMFTTQDDG